MHFSYVDTKFYSGPLLHLIWKRSFYRWRRFHLQGLKTGLRSHLRVDIRKMPTEMHKFIKQSNVSRSLVFKWHKRFSDGRGSLMDDKSEGRPSFKTSDVVKNEVRDVISRNTIPLWLNFLRNCLDASVLFVIFLLITFWVPIAHKCDSCVVLELKFHAPLSLI
jgi:hypothetical protein